VGVFPEFAGREYENFMAVAGEMRTNYDFFHTCDASILPRGDQAVKGPLLRLLKPFDELFVDSQVSLFPPVIFSSDADDLMCMYLLVYTHIPLFAIIRISIRMQSRNLLRCLVSRQYCSSMPTRPTISFSKDTTPRLVPK
jgi:hypothetical protein